MWLYDFWKDQFENPEKLNLHSFRCVYVNSVKLNYFVHAKIIENEKCQQKKLHEMMKIEFLIKFNYSYKF